MCQKSGATCLYSNIKNDADGGMCTVSLLPFPKCVVNTVVKMSLRVDQVSVLVRVLRCILLI